MMMKYRNVYVLPLLILPENRLTCKMAEKRRKKGGFERLVEDTKEVEEFPSDSEDATNYHYAKAGFSYFYDGKDVRKVKEERRGKKAYVVIGDEKFTVEELMEWKKAIFAYGSLRDVKSLASTLGDSEALVLRAKNEPVYNIITRSRGNAFAELVRSKNATTESYVLFVKDDAKTKLDEREENYKLADIGEATLTSWEKVRTQAYIGKTPIWRPEKYGRPVGVKEIQTNGRKHDKTLTHKEALNLAIKEYDLGRHGISTPHDLSDQVTSDPKLASEIVEMKNATAMPPAIDELKRKQIAPADIYMTPETPYQPARLAA